MKTIHVFSIILFIASSVQASQLDNLINNIEKSLASVKKEVQKHPELGEKIDQLIAITKEETKNALNKTIPLLKPIDKEIFNKDCNEVATNFEKDVNFLIQEAENVLSFYQKQARDLAEKHFDKNNFDTAVAIFDAANNTITNAFTSSRIQGDFLNIIKSIKPTLPQKLDITIDSETGFDIHCMIR